MDRASIDGVVGTSPSALGHDPSVVVATATIGVPDRRTRGASEHRVHRTLVDVHFSVDPITAARGVGRNV